MKCIPVQCCSCPITSATDGRHDGQTLPIADNQALFSIIGNIYGGDGMQDFNLPNMPEVQDANGNPLMWILYLYRNFTARQ